MKKPTAAPRKPSPPATPKRTPASTVSQMGKLMNAKASHRKGK